MQLFLQLRSRAVMNSKDYGNNNSDLQNDHHRKIQAMYRLGSWKIDVATSMISATNEACRIYGIEHKSFPLDYIQSITMPEYKEVTRTALEELLDGGTYDIEFKIRRADDGSIRDIHSVAEYDPVSKIVTGAIHDITDEKTVRQHLEESEAKYRSLFENSASGIFYADAEGCIIDVNAKMLKLLGSPSVEETRKINMRTFPLLVEVGFSGNFIKVVNTASSVHGTAKYQSKWGSSLYLDYVLKPVVSDGRVQRVIGKVEDITEQTLTEMEINRLLEEKDILLREIYHRLKNNMASIESLLSIQIESSEDSRSSAPLIDAVNRIKSMRVLYDKLYLSADFINTSIDDYLSTLIDEIRKVFKPGCSVEIVKNIEDFYIPSDKIFPLGLIINELLTNSFKYAFCEGCESGRLYIDVCSRSGTANIRVRDNGPGYPDERTYLESGGFGLRLIDMLVKQIGGTVIFRNDDGAVCAISFGI